MMPPLSELLKFLDLQAYHFKSMPSEWKLQMTTLKYYASAVKEVCVVCSQGSCPLASCNWFQGMMRKEFWDIINTSARCKNCLKSGRMVNKCQAPPMCKKCHKYHHTLLHMEADPKQEETEKPSGSMMYVAPSRWGEEVLLMTYRVKVIVPYGSIMQARAILDCAASTLLITKHLAQQLRLLHHHSNFTINEVAGIDVHSRGTIVFKVAGVWSGRR